MSIHPSLRSKKGSGSNRSVLTRVERLEKLQEDGRWKDGDSVFGLPKIRTFVKKKVKKSKEAAAGAEGEAAAGEAEAAKTKGEGSGK